MNLIRTQLISGKILLVALAFACGPPESMESAEQKIHTQQVERHLAAMGTSLTVLLKAETRAEALAESELAVRAVETVEARLSTWRPGSELSKLNAAVVDSTQQLSDKLAADLQRVDELWNQTGQHFDPALGLLIKAWDLRGTGRIPTEAARASALNDSGWRHYKLTDKTLVRTNQRTQLEEGGFGKGVALDAALAAIDSTKVRSFALELGGQWIVRHQPESPFVIGIAHPQDRSKSLLELQLATGSVATSGNSERGFDLDGTRVGHILSAKTGQPADDFGSLTVIATDAITADCLSTALFVMGPDAALAWATEHADVEIVVIEQLGARPRIRATSGLSLSLTPLSTELEIEFFPPLDTLSGH